MRLDEKSDAKMTPKIGGKKKVEGYGQVALDNNRRGGVFSESLGG